MRTGDKIALGALAGAGAMWGARAWLRSRRRIELAGRVVVVTGASSGLGHMIARHAAEWQARLVIGARNAEALHAAESELRDLGAPEVLAIPTDVTDPEQAKRLVIAAAERFGRLDVLINVAGIIQVGPLPTMTLDDFREALATNFWGGVYTALAALPIMRAQQFGRIANVVSVGGRVAAPHLAPYTASKFAFTGFTKALRIELTRDNILVTGVYPWTMRTGGHRHAFVKGHREAEFAWFALSDTLPLVSTSAEAAAEKVLNAVCHGDPEVFIGQRVRLLMALDALFPNWTTELISLGERVLPGPANLDEPPVQGQELSGTVPGLLNRLVPRNAQPS